MAIKIFGKVLFFVIMLFFGTSYAAENDSFAEACVKGCASASYDGYDEGKGLQACINACMNVAVGRQQDNSSKESNDNYIKSMPSLKLEEDNYSKEKSANYQKLTQKDDLPVWVTGIGNRFSIMFNYSEYDYKGKFSPASYGYITDDSHFASPALYAGYDLMEYVQLGIGYREMKSLDFYAYNAQNKKVYLGEYSSYMIEMFFKAYLLNLPMQQEGSSFQIYAKVSRNRVYEKTKVVGIIVRDEYYTTGFGAGIDFSLGKNSNYVSGGEIKYYVKGKKAFADFTGVNLGYRFDKIIKLGLVSAK